jgi:hypothetical protein
MGCLKVHCTWVIIICLLAGMVVLIPSVTAATNYSGTKAFIFHQGVLVPSTPSTSAGSYIKIGTAVESDTGQQEQGGTLEVSQGGIRGTASSGTSTNTTKTQGYSREMMGLQVSTFDGSSGPKTLGFADNPDVSFTDNPGQVQTLFSKSSAFKAATPVLPKSGGITEKTTVFGKTVATVTNIRATPSLDKTHLLG